MNTFDWQLLRLKERLGLSTNRAVAEMLGLGEKAFSARRCRDSFPVDRLKALAHDRPELGLDVEYVLTGQTQECHGPGLDLHLRVRAGFIEQGTSLKRWCEDNSILPSNARDVLIGRWNGPKGVALRNRLIKASGAEPRA